MGNIKMNLREIGWDGVGWIGLVRSCEHGNEPSSSTTFRKFSQIDEKLTSQDAMCHVVFLTLRTRGLLSSNTSSHTV